MRILPSCSCIITNICLWQLDFYESLKQNARWEQHKSITCSFEHFVGVAARKTTACTATYLVKQTMQERLARHGGHCWRSKGERTSELLQWILTKKHSTDSWSGKKVHSAAMCGHWVLSKDFTKSYVAIYLYIYIYIERQREIKRECQRNPLCQRALIIMMIKT